MRKLFSILVLFLTLFFQGKAQLIPAHPLDRLGYTSISSAVKSMFVRDSTFYLIRGGGLETYSFKNHYGDYHFAGHYPLDCVIPDSGGNYLFLKDHVIGRYSSATHKYENIWPLGSSYIKDIDVSPNGTIYAITGNPFALWSYVGNQWQQIVIPGFTSWFNNIKVANDTLFFLSGIRLYAMHNGTLDTLIYAYDYANFKSWDADAAGNLWIASNTELIHYYNGDTIVYHSSSLPSTTDRFYHVRVGSNGHAWVAGDSRRLYERYNGSWQQFDLPWFQVVKDFALNDQNEPWVLSWQGGDVFNASLKNGTSWLVEPLPFMPLTNSKAVGYYMDASYQPHGQFATREGWFDVDLINSQLTGFYDTASTPYANDVTCFTENGTSANLTFGTHHGVINLNGFNNAMLPDTNINCIVQDNGTWYLGTDSGLLVYNGVFYTVFNTGNSPVPSNKITFLTATTYDPYCFGAPHMLVVGTDKGLATYNNGVWRSYSGANMAVGDFYVTGVIPPCWDTALIVSTMGQGLIKIFPSGAYTVYNTTNGQNLDDSLYYIKYVELAECGSWFIAGTAHHGLMMALNIYNPVFEYDSTMYSVFHCSRNLNGRYLYTITADSTIWLLSACGDIRKEQTKGPELVSYQSGGLLHVEIPPQLSDDGEIRLYDATGKCLVTRYFHRNEQEVQFASGDFVTGLYLIRLQTPSMAMGKKIILVN